MSTLAPPNGRFNPMPSIRQLPFAVADGATNMAADEAMLLDAADGVASLRFYGWSTATLSLGYFQPSSARSSDSRWSPLPFVRRATGGATLVHDRELTYALALPPGRPWHDASPWMTGFHALIRSTLASLGVEASLAADAVHRGEILCFQRVTVGDLVCRGHKIGGSAQRKQRRCLLQHGSILLGSSPYATELPGVAELTGIEIPREALAEALTLELTAATGWRLETRAWTDDDRRRIDCLAVEKFSSATWNEKR